MLSKEEIKRFSLGRHHLIWEKNLYYLDPKPKASDLLGFVYASCLYTNLGRPSKASQHDIGWNQPRFWLFPVFAGLFHTRPI